MSFPTTAVITTNLDSSTDDPSLARADILDAVQKLNSIIADHNGADGVVVLDGSGFISTAQMPTTISVAGTQTISPTSGVVNIQSVLRLSSQSEAAIVALSTPQEGDLALCANLLSSNANVGGICVYNGTSWIGLPWTANVFVSMA